MDATINAIGDLLLKAIPTVIFFLFLTAYLRRVYFKPLAHILEERRRATEGLRELSQQAFASADEKVSEYDRTLQAARAQISAENEVRRRQALLEQSETIARARAEAEGKLAAARDEIAREMSDASAEIESQIQPLADQIIASLLRRRAA
jgi:F-type H+-transporting ATPase subunit b